ncbi:hypothetical protein [Runella slithyformis]|uniref:Uncharacterized protein n=1 Tax=Runella slithyformis (strain ATCC 29530 / DSM 19594 / LMG 11500 / NCIMB 11436 / LSU 4) TaxID=761193 RepID=A0A7U3ZN31_RUNSL|nr:hypothetical protein [Runella slithyformis]AEI50256.1 hypothetical protein Runsl_3900 [Runella slithyformis DSM 19594]
MRNYFYEIYVWRAYYEDEVIEGGRISAPSKKEAKQKIMDMYGDRFSEFIDCYEVI